MLNPEYNSISLNSFDKKEYFNFYFKNHDNRQLVKDRSSTDNPLIKICKYLFCSFLSGKSCV